MLVNGLVALVNSVSAVTALIGVLPTMRLTPQRLPENPVYPAMTYHLVDDNSIVAHSGFSGLVNTRVQLTIWTAKYLQGETIITALKQSQANGGINGYKGTIGGIQFDRIFLRENPSDFSETTQIHQRNLDLLIGYRL